MIKLVRAEIYNLSKTNKIYNFFWRQISIDILVISHILKLIYYIYCTSLI